MSGISEVTSIAARFVLGEALAVGVVVVAGGDHKFDFMHQLGGWNILAERSGGSKDSFLRTYT